MRFGVGGRRRATVFAGFAVAAAVVVAVCVTWLVAGHQNRPMGARVDDVAQGLRCPTCTAVSVSASNSPIAQSMRVQIRQQLRAGRSPEQIRGWFADRYGSQVLLDPEPRGLGLVLWVVPGAALVVALAGLVVARRRPSADNPAQLHRSAISPGRVAVAGVAVLAVGAAVPAALWDAGRPEATASTGAATDMDARDWLSVGASLEQQEAFDQAAKAYRNALAKRPRDAAIRTRLAFVLVRDGKARQALSLVRPLAGQKGPRQAEAVLVLGLAQRAASMPQSTATLRRFLALAPHHPAAGQVRGLLRGAG